MKRILLAIPVIVIIVIVILLQCRGNYSYETAETIAVNDSIQTDMSHRLDETIDSFNLLKPLVEKTISKIKYYEGLRNDYEKQVSAFVTPDRNNYKQDNTEADKLRKKLADANAEIQRLNKELSGLTTKKEYRSYTRPKIDTAETPIVAPDENSIVLDLDGGGIITPDNLTIYLIPYSRKVKKHMAYEASCALGLSENKAATYYKGLYFFNDVEKGKYLIKICTYYGNYKVIKKENGKYNIKMQISPPIQ